MTAFYFGGVSKYDDVAQELFNTVQPEALVLLVLNGNRGHGAVVKQSAAGLSAKARTALAITLVGMARDLDPGTFGGT